MIVSHSKGFCYWKIARTGSNTAELCIRMSGLLDLSQDIVTSCHFFPSSHNLPKGERSQAGHPTAEMAIERGFLTRKQYDEYDHYAIVRNPLDRWVSAYSFRYWREEQPPSPLEFFEAHRKGDPIRGPKGGMDYIVHRQTEYLKLGGVQTFPFSDYENSIRSIISLMGGVLEDVPHMKHKRQRGYAWTAKKALVTTGWGTLTDRLTEWYSEDMKLDY